MLITATLGRLLRNQSTQEQTQANAQVPGSATPPPSRRAAPPPARTGSSARSRPASRSPRSPLSWPAVREGRLHWLWRNEGHRRRGPSPRVCRARADSRALRVRSFSKRSASSRSRAPMRALMAGLRIPVNARMGSFDVGGLADSISANFSRPNDTAAQPPETKIRDPPLHMDPDKLAQRALTSDAAILAIIDGLNGKMHLPSEAFIESMSDHSSNSDALHRLRRRHHRSSALPAQLGQASQKVELSVPWSEITEARSGAEDRQPFGEARVIRLSGRHFFRERINRSPDGLVRLRDETVAVPMWADYVESTNTFQRRRHFHPARLRAAG